MQTETILQCKPHTNEDLCLSRHQQRLSYRKGLRVVCGMVPDFIYIVPPTLAQRAGVLFGLSPAVTPMSGVQQVVTEIFGINN